MTTPDVYTRVTDKIIAELEKGERPWLKPWNAEHAAGKISRPLRHNGLPYSGINVLMLWVEAMEKGFNAPLWMTFKQAQELGGHVRKGKRFSGGLRQRHDKDEHNDATGEDEEHKIPFMKGYTVFNVEQIADLPAHYYATAQEPTLDTAQRLDQVEQFFKHTRAEIRHGGNRAFLRHRR